MKKTPSALKWLAEKRARVVGDLFHKEGLLAEVQAHVAKLSGELTSLDATIAIYDSAIQAHLIAPIHAWQDRHGRRGAFKDALLKVPFQGSLRRKDAPFEPRQNVTMSRVTLRINRRGDVR